MFRVKYLIICSNWDSACFSGLAYNCIRYLRTTESTLVVVFYFPLVATPIMGFIVNWVKPQGLDWVYIVVLGVVTQVAQVFMTKGIQSDSAGNIMTYKYVGVVFAFIYGYFIFKKYCFERIWNIPITFGVILNAIFKNEQVEKMHEKYLNPKGVVNVSL